MNNKDENFGFDSAKEMLETIAKYESMIRKGEEYFFDSEVFQNIITFYLEGKKDPVKALEAVDIANGQHGYDAVFLLLKSQIYASMNQLEESQELLEQASNLDPNSDAIFMVRGNLARISGNLEQAEEYYLQALENDADESVVYEAIAFLYLEKEQFKKGIFYLKKA